MTPLPKRKHSTRRTGRRERSKNVTLATLVKCDKCGKSKLPHHTCKYCNK